MKAKVLQKFKDKYTGEVHNVGKILTVSKERFAEILSVAPLVEECEKEKTAKKEKE